RPLRTLPPFPYTPLFRSTRAADLAPFARHPLRVGHDPGDIRVQAPLHAVTDLAGAAALIRRLLAEECLRQPHRGRLLPHACRSRSEEHTSELQSRENLVC